MNGFLQVLSKAETPSKPLDAPKVIPAPPTDIKTRKIDLFSDIPTLTDIKEYGYIPDNKTTGFIGGEKEALRRMEEFLVQKQRVASFDKPKTNPTAIEPDTTALSPYLTHGSLSARLFYSRLKQTTSTQQTMWSEVSLVISLGISLAQDLFGVVSLAESLW